MIDLISRTAVLRMLDEDGVVFRGTIEKMPAVDAVPVNWISAYMNKTYGRVRAEIIREMLDAWMEQEAR